MSERMKGRPTKRAKRREIPLSRKLPGVARKFCYAETGQIFQLPLSEIERNQVSREVEQKARDRFFHTMKKQEELVDADDVFKELDKKYSKAGAMLKGLRFREGLSQVEFAKKIRVTQGDLSKMENGKRSIGKEIAQRIEARFKVSYRIFLG